MSPRTFTNNQLITESAIVKSQSRLKVSLWAEGQRDRLEDCDIPPPPNIHSLSQPPEGLGGSLRGLSRNLSGIQW